MRCRKCWKTRDNLRRSALRFKTTGYATVFYSNNASVTPYGWDGDRLIHTEQIEPEQPEQRRITHTVYEPDSFTPLVQLSTTKAANAGKPAVLGLMLQEAQEPEEAPMAQMLGALPKDMQQALEQSLRQAMEGGIPSAMRTLMGDDQSQNTLQRLTGLREQLEKQEQEQKTPIDIRYYHCDHLGTPLALTDSQGQIVWAARLDPWGNVEEEFNPHQIEQSIRLPGQHHDRETGLYYNRHRYYDPTIGSYVNQDPIGLNGGVNSYAYPEDPNQLFDPVGLAPSAKASQGARTRGWKGWNGGREQPVKPDLTSTQKISEGWGKAKEKLQEAADSFSEFVNKITGRDAVEARVQEALVCTKQQNTKTQTVSQPNEVIAPNSRGVAVVRPPSPNELLPDEICLSTEFRKMDGGPLPGLEVPGKL